MRVCVYIGISERVRKLPTQCIFLLPRYFIICTKPCVSDDAESDLRSAGLLPCLLRFLIGVRNEDKMKKLFYRCHSNQSIKTREIAPISYQLAQSNFSRRGKRANAAGAYARLPYISFNLLHAHVYNYVHMVCVRKYLRTYVYIYIHIYIHMYVYVHTRVYLCVSIILNSFTERSKLSVWL